MCLIKCLILYILYYMSYTYICRLYYTCMSYKIVLIIINYSARIFVSKSIYTLVYLRMEIWHEGITWYRTIRILINVNLLYFLKLFYSLEIIAVSKVRWAWLAVYLYFIRHLKKNFIWTAHLMYEFPSKKRTRFQMFDTDEGLVLVKFNLVYWKSLIWCHSLICDSAQANL